MKLFIIATILYVSNSYVSSVALQRQEITNSSHPSAKQTEDSNSTITSGNPHQKAPVETNKTVGFTLTHNMKSVSIEKGKSEEQIQYYENPSVRPSSKNMIAHQKVEPKNKMMKHPQIINHKVPIIHKKLLSHPVSHQIPVHYQRGKNAFVRANHVLSPVQKFEDETFEQEADPEAEEEETYTNQLPQFYNYPSENTNPSFTTEQDDSTQEIPIQTTQAVLYEQQMEEEPQVVKPNLAAASASTASVFTQKPSSPTYQPPAPTYPPAAPLVTTPTILTSPPYVAPPAIQQLPTNVQSPTTTVKLIQYPTTTAVPYTAPPVVTTPPVLFTTPLAAQFPEKACPEEIESLGCFASSPRQKSTFQILISKKTQGQSLEDFLCSCATMVQSRGWYTLSLQQDSCYSGRKEGLYDSQGQSVQCVNDLGVECSAADTYCQGGVGAMSVYSIITQAHRSVVRG